MHSRQAINYGEFYDGQTFKVVADPYRGIDSSSVSHTNLMKNTLLDFNNPALGDGCIDAFGSMSYGSCELCQMREKRPRIGFYATGSIKLVFNVSDLFL